MRTKTQHTPGPWTGTEVPGNGQMFAIKSPHKPESCAFVIATTPRTHGTENLREQEANVRLIAAAPDLLEAANTLLDVLPWASDYGGGPGDQEKAKATKRLILAIAKAEGK